MFNTENKIAYPSTTFDQDAEQYLIELLLQEVDNKDFKLQRMLSSYPLASEQEKGILILKILGYLWPLGSPSNLFAVFRDFDTVLSLIKGKGNFIHSFEVYLLGFHIIKLLLDVNEKNILQSQFRPDKRIYDSWLITSTAHDFGYPLEVIPELSNKFSELFKLLYLNGVAKKAKELSAIRKLHLQKSLLSVEVYNVSRRKKETINVEHFVLEGIKNSIDGNINDAREIRDVLKESLIKIGKQEHSYIKHSYVSALILARSYINYLSTSKKWENKKELWRTQLLKKVAAAIALHALPSSREDLINKISFDLNPVAYILFLVDNIQDWNRSLRPSEKHPTYILTDYTSSGKEISIGYTLEHGRWKKKMVTDAKNYIADKQKKFKALKPPRRSLNISIFLRFSTDHGIDLGTIALGL